MTKDELISGLEKYNEIKVLAEKILYLYDDWNSPYDIEYIGYEEENNLYIKYSYYTHGETYYESFDIPFQWFDMSDDELKTTIEEYKRIEKEERERAEALREQKRKEEAEAFERKEYERLKAKYAQHEPKIAVIGNGHHTTGTISEILNNNLEVQIKEHKNG